MCRESRERKDMAQEDGKKELLGTTAKMGIQTNEETLSGNVSSDTSPMVVSDLVTVLPNIESFRGSALQDAKVRVLDPSCNLGEIGHIKYILDRPCNGEETTWVVQLLDGAEVYVTSSRLELFGIRGAQPQ